MHIVQLLTRRLATRDHARQLLPNTITRYHTESGRCRSNVRRLRAVCFTPRSTGPLHLTTVQAYVRDIINRIAGIVQICSCIYENYQFILFNCIVRFRRDTSKIIIQLYRVCILNQLIGLCMPISLDSWYLTIFLKQRFQSQRRGCCYGQR